jgi:hypothetical protein
LLPQAASCISLYWLTPSEGHRDLHAANTNRTCGAVQNAESSSFSGCGCTIEFLQKTTFAALKFGGEKKNTVRRRDTKQTQCPKDKKLSPVIFVRICMKPYRGCVAAVSLITWFTCHGFCSLKKQLGQQWGYNCLHNFHKSQKRHSDAVVHSLSSESPKLFGKYQRPEFSLREQHMLPVHSHDKQIRENATMLAHLVRVPF